MKRNFIPTVGAGLFFIIFLVFYLFSGRAFISIPKIFIIFILLILSRFYRFSLKRFSFISFTPIAHILSIFLFGPFTTGIASLFGLVVSEHYIRQKKVSDSLFNAFVYAGASFLFGFVVPAKGNPQVYQGVIFLVLYSLFFPILFYLPDIFKGQFERKNLAFVLFWEDAFIMYFGGLVYILFILLTAPITTNSIIILLFAIFAFGFGFFLFKESIRREKLSMFLKVEESISQHLSFEKVLMEIEMILKEFCKIIALNVGTYVESEDTLHLIYSTHKGGILENPRVIKRGEALAWKVMETRREVYFPDAKKQREFLELSPDTSSEVMYPLFFEGKIIGVFGVESSIPYGFYDDDIERMRYVAEIISRSLGVLLNIFNFRKASENLDIEAEHLTSLTRGIIDTTQKVGKRIARASENLEEVKQVSHKDFQILEGLGQSMEHISENTREVIPISDEIKRLFKDKVPKLTNFLGSLEKMEERFLEMKKNVEKLNEFYQKMEDFLNFVRDYGAKTRLLSLNAAIEATRAGQESMGFGVIAEEIGKLAESGENLTKQIYEEFSKSTTLLDDIDLKLKDYEEIIGEQRSASQDVVKTIRELKDKYEDYFDSIKNIPEILQKEVGNLQKVIKSIGEALELQEKNTESLESVVSGTKDLTVSLEEISSLSQDIDRNSRALREMVEAFHRSKEG